MLKNKSLLGEMLRGFFISDESRNISLELRVKEKLLPYPEEMFFDSQGIPAKPY
jgi:hypothetical protein